MVDRLIDDKGGYHTGFYDNVVELTAEERAMLGHAPFNEKEYMESIGVQALTGEEGLLLWKEPG